MNSIKLVLVFLVFAPISLFAQNDATKSGKELFNDKCFACHRFDKKLVGPPLEGLSHKHDTAWLHAWLEDSDKLIKSGDYFANSIFDEYHKAPCVTNLNEKDTEKVLAYIDSFPTKKDAFRSLNENQLKGKKLFNANCAACHKLDKRLVGPPLRGIANKREREWLHAIIKDSQALIDSGDTLAVQIFEEYNRIPMLTYPNFSEEDIDNILAYLDEGEVIEVVIDESEKIKIKGKKLFDNNCLACHELEKKIIATPLKGITNKRDRKWLHAFIKDGQTMIDSGDSLAIQVSEKNEYKIPIPANPDLSEEDIDAILAYLKEDKE